MTLARLCFVVTAILGTSLCLFYNFVFSPDVVYAQIRCPLSERGDVNCSNEVDIFDFSMVVTNFGRTPDIRPTNSTTISTTPIPQNYCEIQGAACTYCPPCATEDPACLLPCYSDGICQANTCIPPSSPTQTIQPTTTGPIETPATNIIVLFPIADTRVEENTPARTYGSQQYLRSNMATGSISESYLKFDLSGITGRVKNARLRFVVRNVNADLDGTTQSHRIYSMTDTSWTEKTLSWNTPRPMLIAPIGILQPGAPGEAIISTDLSPTIQSTLGSVISLGVGPCITCADSLHIQSRETAGTNNDPRLILELE